MQVLSDQNGRISFALEEHHFVVGKMFNQQQPTIHQTHTHKNIQRFCYFSSAIRQWRLCFTQYKYIVCHINQFRRLLEFNVCASSCGYHKSNHWNIHHTVEQYTHSSQYKMNISLRSRMRRKQTEHPQDDVDRHAAAVVFIWFWSFANRIIESHSKRINLQTYAAARANQLFTAYTF